MNRKKRIKSIILALVTAMVLCTTVFAAPVWKNVSIAYNNLKVNIDGVETILTDLEGRAIEPFIYDGVAYVPLSPLARALDKNAVYDGSAGTIFITTPAVPPPPKPAPPKVEYFFDVLTEFENNNYNISSDQSFKMLGDEYTRGWFFGGGGNRSQISSVSYNLRGQYKTIKGVLGHIDGQTRDFTGTVSFYVGLEKKFHKTYPVTGTMKPMEIEINVIGVDILTIEWVVNGSTYYYAVYGLGNVTIE